MSNAKASHIEILDVREDDYYKTARPGVSGIHDE